VTWSDHDHRGEYAESGHDHYDYAERHHSHYELESELRGLREDLSRALERIRELEDRNELAELEPEPEDFDPGPEVDDEGGMSEYRHALHAEEPW
jgi:hypothetical protein